MFVYLIPDNQALGLKFYPEMSEFEIKKEVQKREIVVLSQEDYILEKQKILNEENFKDE